MAKKKKKFKKKISQNLSQRLAEIEVEEKIRKPDQPEVKVEASNSAKIAEDDRFSYVKKDVKRDLIIIGSLIIILAVTTIINYKTGYLKSAADWLYTSLNLSV